MDVEKEDGVMGVGRVKGEQWTKETTESFATERLALVEPLRPLTPGSASLSSSGPSSGPCKRQLYPRYLAGYVPRLHHQMRARSDEKYIRSSRYGRPMHGRDKKKQKKKKEEEKERKQPPAAEYT
ncbi:hypothetical protein LX32DRAFT_647115 [Colletotrichum zoysiae]|uniref:Uncharacterized protein n=1 Tax=Colletotrichum zoysiae TaxID=1216348 RepID=A0AAD9H3N3_9PEZI|nr:hypothetical protein LX32DRAFT_647115 [Colletotrichum zoysiae]